MERQIGKVIEVFIPKQYKNGNLLDVMDCTNIGFKVQLPSEIIEIIQEQNEENATILKNDPVLIIKQTISNQEFIDIYKYDGDIDEE